MAKNKKANEAMEQVDELLQDAPESSEEASIQDVRKLQDARAGIAKKARAKRQADIKTADDSMSEHDQALLERMRAEASGEEVETETQATAKAIKDGLDKQEPIAGEETTEAKQPEAKEVENELVDVVIYGHKHQVPKKDVDRAGGILAYQKDRAASIRMQRAATREQQLRKMEREITEREKKLAEAERASRNVANDPGDKPSDKDAHDGSDDRKTQVNAIVEKMYSGSQERAAEAVQEILEQSKPGLSAEAVADLVIQRLEQRERQTEASEAPPRETGVSEVDRAEVNSVMANEFADVIADGDMRAVALLRFEAQRQAPENRGRALSDIARDAGEYARNRLSFQHEVLKRDKIKDQLPRQPTAEAKVKPQPKEKVPTVQTHIQRLRQRAGLEQKPT